LAVNDPTLWLSRSWTTRRRRPGETEGAYVFVDRPTFMERVDSGGFFEWAEFLGHLYGTPMPDPGVGRDILLEIDLQGARQVRQLRPDATLILLLPPSADIQAARLRARGDDESAIAQRLRTGADEELWGRSIADAVVFNDDAGRAIAEVAGIVEGRRLAARQGGVMGGGAGGVHRGHADTASQPDPKPHPPERS
jgi:guanylate kinase